MLQCLQTFQFLPYATPNLESVILNRFLFILLPSSTSPDVVGYLFPVKAREMWDRAKGTPSIT